LCISAVISLSEPFNANVLWEWGIWDLRVLTISSAFRIQQQHFHVNIFKIVDSFQVGHFNQLFSYFVNIDAYPCTVVP